VSVFLDQTERECRIRIDDVSLEGGRITIVDRSGMKIVLPASRGL